jgi:hypothetical protein
VTLIDPWPAHRGDPRRPGCIFTHDGGGEPPVKVDAMHVTDAQLAQRRWISHHRGEVMRHGLATRLIRRYLARRLRRLIAELHQRGTHCRVVGWGRTRGCGSAAAWE